MDASPNKNNCRNCGRLLPEAAQFCPACGQKNTDGRLTFRELLDQLAENLFSLDARILQTLGTLAVPGKLTKNFFEGKHIRYYHPIRLFVFSVALLIASISLSLPTEKLAAADDDWIARKEKINQGKVFLALDSLTQTAQATATGEQTLAALDSLSTKIGELKPYTEKDSIPMGQLVNFGAGDAPTADIMMSMDDVMSLSADSLCEKYQVTGFKDRLMVKQGVRVMRSPSSFLNYLIGNILWMVLIMMPMLALVLKGVYFRQDFLYYEHLVFSFHIHTFLFFASAILIPLQIWSETNVASFGIPLSLLYPVLALKRFYGQNWWWTIAKGVLLSILYLLVFSLSFFLMSVFSIFLF